MNQEFSDYFHQGLPLEDICQRFLGPTIVRHRQTASLILDGFPHQEAASVRQLGKETLEYGMTIKRLKHPPWSNDITALINDLPGHKPRQLQLPEDQPTVPQPAILASATTALTGEPRNEANDANGPILFVGEHAAVLLFDGVSVDIRGKGVIENSGTLFLGPNMDRMCLRSAEDSPVSKAQCLKPSLIMEESASFVAHRPVRVARLELKAVATLPRTENPDGRDAQWSGVIGYPPSFPDADVSALVINHGTHHLRMVTHETSLAFKQLEISGPPGTVPTAVFTLTHPEEPSGWALTIFTDLILSGHDRAQLIINGLALKLSKYHDDQLQVLQDISLSSDVILVDRAVTGWRGHTYLGNASVTTKPLSVLRFFCTNFCDVNNQVHQVVGRDHHVQLIAGGLR